MALDYRFNIGVIGGPSVGKTTIINSLLEGYFSQTGKSKNSFTPQIYHEKIDLNYNLDQMQKIYKLNTEISNKQIVDQLEISRVINTVEHNISRITDLAPVLEDDIHISIYDIPSVGLKSIDTLWTWLDDNIHKFDLILFVTEINSAFNTKEEIELLHKIMYLLNENITIHEGNKIIIIDDDNNTSKRKKTEIIPIINKCDSLKMLNNDLFFANLKVADIMGKYIDKVDFDENEMTIPDNLTIDEMDKIDKLNGITEVLQSEDIDNLKAYIQANNVYHMALEKYGLNFTVQNFIPISAENAYFLKILNKNHSFLEKLDAFTVKSLGVAYCKFYSNKKEWYSFSENRKISELLDFKSSHDFQKELKISGWTDLISKMSEILRDNKAAFVNNKFIDFKENKSFDKCIDTMLDLTTRFQSNIFQKELEDLFEKFMEKTDKLLNNFWDNIVKKWTKQSDSIEDFMKIEPLSSLKYFTLPHRGLSINKFIAEVKKIYQCINFTRKSIQALYNEILIGTVCSKLHQTDFYDHDNCYICKIVNSKIYVSKFLNKVECGIVYAMSFNQYACKMSKMSGMSIYRYTWKTADIYLEKIKSLHSTGYIGKIETSVYILDCFLGTL